jgi:hypothetical protein
MQRQITVPGLTEPFVYSLDDGLTDPDGRLLDYEQLMPFSVEGNSTAAIAALHDMARYVCSLGGDAAIRVTSRVKLETLTITGVAVKTR